MIAEFKMIGGYRGRECTASYASKKYNFSIRFDSECVIDALNERPGLNSRDRGLEGRALGGHAIDESVFLLPSPVWAGEPIVENLKAPLL